MRQNISLAHQRLRQREKRPESESGSQKPVRSSMDAPRSAIGAAYEKLILPTVKRKHFVSDTGRLNYPLLQEMLEAIREQAEASGLSELPVVLTNHPKDIRDIAAIERFVGDVSQADDMKFTTLTEIASKLRSGKFQVRCVSERKSH